jgi:hypothetical protein
MIPNCVGTQKTDLMKDYLQKHFVGRAAFVRRCGGTVDQIDRLLEAKAAPGVIYSQSKDGDYWSALAGFVGASAANPSPGGSDWYAPSAVWWMRRAILASRDDVDVQSAAILNREHFIRQFIAALRDIPHSRLNYPDCFSRHGIAEDKAREAALDEWAGWVSGAYAVCLSSFSGGSCVRKEVNACRIRKHFEGADPSLCLDPTELFNLTEELASLLMPFAPFERATGTPGKAVDRTLDFLNLGIEEPYA